MSTECFLCTFNNHIDAIDMTQFVHEIIGIMCTDVLANEVRIQLQKRQGDCSMTKPSRTHCSIKGGPNTSREQAAPWPQPW
jgi:hypothetical protein